VGGGGDNVLASSLSRANCSPTSGSEGASQIIAPHQRSLRIRYDEYLIRKLFQKRYIITLLTHFSKKDIDTSLLPI
jgi:hypothetical protein